jgi:hypothetical protein
LRLARTCDVTQAIDEAVAVERVQGRIADMPLNPKAPWPEGMVNKIKKPSSERRLLSGGLVTLTVGHWSRFCFRRNRLSGLIGGSQPKHLIAGYAPMRLAKTGDLRI